MIWIYLFHQFIYFNLCKKWFNPCELFQHSFQVKIYILVYIFSPIGLNAFMNKYYGYSCCFQFAILAPVQFPLLSSSINFSMVTFVQILVLSHYFGSLLLENQLVTFSNGMNMVILESCGSILLIVQLMKHIFVEKIEMQWKEAVMHWVISIIEIWSFVMINERKFEGFSTSQCASYSISPKVKWSVKT